MVLKNPIRSASPPALLAAVCLALAGCGAAAEVPEAQPAATPVAQGTVQPAVVPVAQAAAQEVPGVDLSSLNDAQRAQAIQIFEDNGCNCGCGMTIMKCRHNDPNCQRSPVLAAQIVQQLAQGKSPAEAEAALKTAAPPALAAPAGAPTAAAAAAKPEELVFDVPTGDSYAVGPENAPVTLVTWLDYQ